MTRISSTLVSVAATAALFAFFAGAPAASSRAVAHEAGGCHVGQNEWSDGPTYLLSLTTKNTGCTQGRKVVHEYCRGHHCGGSVYGYRCYKQKAQANTIGYYAHAECYRGSKVVRFFFNEWYRY